LHATQFQRSPIKGRQSLFPVLATFEQAATHLPAGEEIRTEARVEKVAQ
jgi:hypothetical protein